MSGLGSIRPVWVRSDWVRRHWKFWASFLGVALPFGYQIFGDLFGLGGGVSWLGLVAGAAALVYLAWRGLALRQPLPHTGLETVLLVSLGALLISLLFSPDPRMGLEQALWSVGYVILFFFLVDAAEAGASRTGAVYGMLFVTGLVALLAVLETYAWYLAFWQQAGTMLALPPYPYRMMSVLSHANLYMAFTNLAAPLAVVIFLITRRRSVRFLAGLWLAVYLISVPFSSSRGGWLGMAAWIGILALYGALEDARWKRAWAWLGRNRVWALPGAALLLIVALPVLWRLYLSFASHPSHGSNPFGGRAGLWGAAIDIWRAYPVTGAGVGRYLYEYLRVVPDFPPGFWSFHAHNLYLTTLAEQGILGLLALLALVGVGLARMFSWQRCSPPGLRPWTAAMVAGVASWLVHSIFDDFTTTFPVMVQVVLLVSFLRAGMCRDKRLVPEMDRPARRVPLAALFALIIPALALTLWVGWAAAPLGQAVERVKARPVTPAAWTEAAALASESARRDPAFVYYQVQAGLAWAQAWGESGDPSHLAQARRSLDRALQLEPSLSLVWANAAVLDWQAGERDRAVERMRAAVDRAPREPSYPLNLGWFLEQQGQDEPAAQWYARALELSPGLSTHAFWQGSAVRARAAETAARALRQSMEEAPPYWKQAQDALQAGDLAGARTAAAQSRAAGEDELAVLAMQAALAGAEGRPEEARAVYRDLVDVLQGDYLFMRSYVAGMVARMHKRPGFDLEVVPGYLLIKPDYGQVQALQQLYAQQVSTGDCAAAEQTWLAVRASEAVESAQIPPYPGCGAPLP